MAIWIRTSIARSAAPRHISERLDSAKGYFYWLADRARAKHDVRTAEGKVAVLQLPAAGVQDISDRLERMAIANDLAGYIGVDRGMVLDAFPESGVGSRGDKAIERPRIVLRPDERMLLNALLAEPEMPGRNDSTRCDRLEAIDNLAVAAHLSGRSSRSRMPAAAWASTRSMTSRGRRPEPVGGRPY